MRKYILLKVWINIRNFFKKLYKNLGWLILRVKVRVIELSKYETYKTLYYTIYNYLVKVLPGKFNKGNERVMEKSVSLLVRSEEQFKHLRLVKVSVLIGMPIVVLAIGIYLFQFEISFYLFPEYIIEDLTMLIDQGAMIMRNANYADINGYIFPDMHYDDKLSVAASTYFLLKYRKYVRRLQFLRRWRSSGLEDSDMVAYVHKYSSIYYPSMYYPHTWSKTMENMYYNLEYDMYRLRLYYPSSQGSRLYIYGPKYYYHREVQDRVGPINEYSITQTGREEKERVQKLFIYPSGAGEYRLVEIMKSIPTIHARLSHMTGYKLGRTFYEMMRKRAFYKGTNTPRRVLSKSFVRFKRKVKRRYKNKYRLRRYRNKIYMKMRYDTSNVFRNFLKNVDPREEDYFYTIKEEKQNFEMPLPKLRWYNTYYNNIKEHVTVGDQDVMKYFTKYEPYSKYEVSHVKTELKQYLLRYNLLLNYIKTDDFKKFSEEAKLDFYKFMFNLEQTIETLKLLKKNLKVRMRYVKQPLRDQYKTSVEYPLHAFTSIKNIYGFEPHDIIHGYIVPRNHFFNWYLFARTYRKYLLPFLRTDSLLQNEDIDVNPFIKREQQRLMFKKRGALGAFGPIDMWYNGKNRFYSLYTDKDREYLWRRPMMGVIGGILDSHALDIEDSNKNTYGLHTNRYSSYKFQKGSEVKGNAFRKARSKFRAFFISVPKEFYPLSMSGQEMNLKNSQYMRYRQILNAHHLSSLWLQPFYIDNWSDNRPYWFLSPFQNDKFVLLDKFPKSVLEGENESEGKWDEKEPAEFHFPAILRYHIQSDIADEAKLQEATNNAIKVQIINDKYHIEKEKFLEFYKKLPISTFGTERVFFEDPALAPLWLYGVHHNFSDWLETLSEIDYYKWEYFFKNIFEFTKEGRLFEELWNALPMPPVAPILSSTGTKDNQLPDHYRENFGINAGINAINQRILANSLHNRISRVADDAHTYFQLAINHQDYFLDRFRWIWSAKFYMIPGVEAVVQDMIGPDARNFLLLEDEDEDGIGAIRSQARRDLWFTFYRPTLGAILYNLFNLNYYPFLTLRDPNKVRDWLRKRHYEHTMYRMILSRAVTAKLGPDSIIMPSNEIENRVEAEYGLIANPEAWDVEYIQYDSPEREIMTNRDYHNRFAAYYYTTFPEKIKERNLPHQNIFLELYRRYSNATYDYFTTLKRIEPFIMYHENYADMKSALYAMPRHLRKDWDYHDIMDGETGTPEQMFQHEREEGLKHGEYYNRMFRYGKYNRPYILTSPQQARTYRKFMSQFKTNPAGHRWKRYFADKNQPWDEPFYITSHTLYGPSYILVRHISRYYKHHPLYNTVHSENFHAWGFRTEMGHEGFDDENIRPIGSEEYDVQFDYGYPDPFNNEFLINRNRFNMANDSAVGVNGNWESDRWTRHFSEEIIEKPEIYQFEAVPISGAVASYEGDKTHDQSYYPMNNLFYPDTFPATQSKDVIDGYYPHMDTLDDDMDRATFWETFFTRYKYKPKNFYFNKAIDGEFRKYFLNIDNNFGTFLFYKKLGILSSMFFNLNRVYQFFVTDQDVNSRFKTFVVNFDSYVGKYLPLSVLFSLISYLVGLFSFVFNFIISTVLYIFKIWYAFAYSICFKIGNYKLFPYLYNKFITWLGVMFGPGWSNMYERISLIFNKYVYSQYAEMFQYFSYLGNNIFTYFTTEGFESYFRILGDIFFLDYRFWFTSMYAVLFILFLHFLAVQYFRDDSVDTEDAFENFWTYFLIIGFFLVLVACLLSGFDRHFVDLMLP